MRTQEELVEKARQLVVTALDELGGFAAGSAQVDADEAAFVILDGQDMRSRDASDPEVWRDHAAMMLLQALANRLGRGTDGRDEQSDRTGDRNQGGGTSWAARPAHGTARAHGAPAVVPGHQLRRWR